MNIQQYYQETASIRLNGSIVSAGLLSIILTVSLLLSWDVPLLVVTVPFLLICFLQYNSYLIYRNRSEESKESVGLYADRELLAQNQLLIAFAPAPAIKLLFFTPDGMLAGEMKEIKLKKWRWFLPYSIDKWMVKHLGIYDVHGILQACLVIDSRKTKLLNAGGETVGFYYPKKNSGKAGTAIVDGGKKLKLVGPPAISPDLILTDMNGRPVSKIQQGWMPLEWSRLFKDANTPVLTFEYHLSFPERMAVFAALSNRYLYHDH